MLTASEYCNAARFPITTQAGLKFEDQHLLDAHKYDAMQEAKENGRPFSERAAAGFKELEFKLANVPVGAGAA